MTMAKRAAVLAAVLLVPTPAYAHTVGGEGGVEIEFAVLALMAIVFGFSLRGRSSVKTWVPWAIVGAGIVFAGAAFAVPRVGGGPSESDAVVSIVEPAPGSRVPAGEPVKVEVEVRNGTVAESATDESGGHLHLFVDGELQYMQYSTEAELELGPGTHEIRVEYVDFQHLSFDPPVEDVIEVTAR